MDSDTYKVPGNYYCTNNSIAESLINCPVYNAFILKVDYSNGHIYPRQTFCNYTNDIITSRTWDPYANKWGKFHQIALKSDLPTLERIHCTFFNDTSLRGEISKDIVNAAFVAPVAYNSIGVKVKQVYRTGKTIILFGESFSNTDSLDISVICY